MYLPLDSRRCLSTFYHLLFFSRPTLSTLAPSLIHSSLSPFSLFNPFFFSISSPSPPFFLSPFHTVSHPTHSSLYFFPSWLCGWPHTAYSQSWAWRRESVNWKGVEKKWKVEWKEHMGEKGRKERKHEGRRNQGMFSASANNLLLSLKHLCCCFCILGHIDFLWTVQFSLHKTVKLVPECQLP